jgi:hypothetical protein
LAICPWFLFCVPVQSILKTRYNNVISHNRGRERGTGRYRDACEGRWLEEEITRGTKQARRKDGPRPVREKRFIKNSSVTWKGNAINERMAESEHARYRDYPLLIVSCFIF